MAFRGREVTLTAVVALGAWVLANHWLPALRWTPYAFLAGASSALVALVYLLLFRYPGGYDVSRHHAAQTTSLSFTSLKHWRTETDGLQHRQRYTKPAIPGCTAELTQSLDILLNLIVRDFVKSWYTRLSRSNGFPNEIDRAVRTALSSFSERLQSRDLVRLGVTKLLPLLNEHLQHFIEAERLVHGREPSGKDVEYSEQLDIAIAAKYNDGKTHPAASLAASRSAAPQQKHLRQVVNEIMPLVLPENMITSPSVSVLIQEIVSSAVLLPVTQMLSDPDFLNQQIEAYGRAVLHERKTVKKLRAALDEHAPPQPNRVRSRTITKLDADASEKTFERYTRSIRHTSDIAEAKKMKREILRQIAKERDSPAQNKTYLKRLEIGSKLLDQRIDQLSQASISGSLDADETLRGTLFDATGLSYFMEYMDRLSLITMVQFWVVTDSLRNISPRALAGRAEVQTSWTEPERQLVSRIYNSYLWRPELAISETSQRPVKHFLDAKAQATNAQYEAARSAVLEAQVDVYQSMERMHFPAFKKSDLWTKWRGSEEGAAKKSENAPNGISSKPGGRRPRPVAAISQEVLPNKTNVAQKSPDLRRAIASSSDLLAEARHAEAAGEARRSLDGSSPRRSLFDDDFDTDPLANSVDSLDSDVESPMAESITQARAIDAVQAALDDIVDEEVDDKSILSRRSSNPSFDVDSERGSLDISRPQGMVIPLAEKSKPSLSSLGLLGTPSKRTVFSEGDLFGDSEKLWEDEQPESEVVPEEKKGDDEDEIRQAAPGDLGLAEVVQALSLDIDKLEAQQSIVDSLIDKSELTNNTAELKILYKSRASLAREIHRKEMQRQQYIVQENDHNLYGKTTVSIKSIMIGTEPDGHEYALYVIEVQRQGGEKSATASWAIARRYSEFHELHKRLRLRFATVRDTEFPRRQMVLTLQKDFVKKRRVALERYLRHLLTMPAVCSSLEFRAFLSQQAIRPLDASAGDSQVDRRDFITRIYNSVTDGMEEFLGNVPVLDQLSLAGQNLISAATSATSAPDLQSHKGNTLANDTAALYMPAAIANDPATAAEAQAEISAFDTPPADAPAPATRRPDTTTFISPIADGFLTLFQLNTGNAWLRGRAVVVVLQQLLGGTVERKVRETFRAFAAPDALSRYVDALREVMWPGGVPRGPTAPRSRAQKEQSRREAAEVLVAVLTEVAGGVVGRGAARDAGRRLSRCMGNERLNRHIAFTILDEVVDVLFGVQVRR